MNRLRFRSGQGQMRKVRVAAATMIEAGDLVWLDTGSGLLRPACEFPNPATTYGMGAFTAAFLGVAQQQSRVGDTEAVYVDIGPYSVYEFEVIPAQFELGDCLWSAVDRVTGQFLNQVLERTRDQSMAIARAAEYTDGERSTLRVTFASAFNTGSANVNARMGHAESARLVGHDVYPSASQNS